MVAMIVRPLDMTTTLGTATSTDKNRVLRRSPLTTSKGTVVKQMVGI